MENAGPDPITTAALSNGPEARVTNGPEARVDAALPEIYGELRALAARQFGPARGSTLQPTALVHEAFLRLRKQDGLTWRSRTHFFALAAREVRRALVDHWRRTQAGQRPDPSRRLPLESARQLIAGESDGVAPEELLALDEALGGLAAEHPRQAKVAEMAYFAGLTQPEIGELLGLSRKTIAADWAFARTWLARELSR